MNNNPRIPIPDITNSEIVYKGYFDVQIDHLKLPHGPTLLYSVLKIGVNAVAVLARTKEGKFVINKEYRHPTGKWLLSCPGGRIDTGESPIEAAKRELIEETGYTGGTFKQLGAIHPFPAVSDQVIYYVLVEDAVFVQQPALETFELIHTELKTHKELLHEMKEGYPIDGILCTALFLLDHD
ncbi:MAG: NUDIX hydrolase [Candidatus Melainabacteria bacterium]|nr:NUDIX hydrolase [Candidatus Melainabacteria bacterium]